MDTKEELLAVEALRQLNEQRLSAIQQRKERMLIFCEAAFTYMESTSVLGADKNVSYGTLSSEGAAVRNLSQKIAELDLAIRLLQQLITKAA